MARRTKLTAEEIRALDETKQQEAGRVQSRKNGFSIMSQRDMGFGRLKDQTGREVTMLWHVPEHSMISLPPGAYRSQIPNGKFVLEFRGKDGVTDRMVFEAEDFHKLLRWV